MESISVLRPWQDSCVGELVQSITVREEVKECGERNMFSSRALELGTFISWSVVYQQSSKESATLQPFFTLQLDIQSDKIRTVQDALESLVARESVQDVPVYRCFYSAAESIFSVYILGCDSEFMKMHWGDELRANNYSQSDAGWLTCALTVGDSVSLARFYGLHLQRWLPGPGCHSTLLMLFLSQLRESLAARPAGELSEDTFEQKVDVTSAAQVEISRRVTLEKLPPVLVLHLKRFVYEKTGGCQKLIKNIEYPVDLEISKARCLGSRKQDTGIAPNKPGRTVLVPPSTVHNPLHPSFRVGDGGTSGMPCI
ncbi:hypothetical protein P7K49_036868 [Saguinus oedipus]|uniref:ubiquitinyl hydrolase 1 n=1 Tax=Saguinus oedipus TaxID=9490 RepID=A0ABQ9TMC0_SAGOE|nr:hypothetical protein P7K49_036868 [Saguinus oedipus]